MGDRYNLDCSYRSRYGTIAGIDEAGRGPVAGPLVACAVVLPDHFDNHILNDSKKLTDRRRRILQEVIENNAVSISLGVVTPAEIDSNRMSWAVRTSFNRAIEGTAPEPALYLVDGNGVPGLSAPAAFLIKGDSRSLSIAAASVIAKVTRDDIMIQADREYPEYGFARHKGYGTRAHINALREHGPCPVHRMSFEPLASMYQTGQLDMFGRQSCNPGGAAEGKVAEYFTKLGYTVLERNWRCSAGEIDLIAERNGTVVFAEVKYSSSGTSAETLRRIDSRKIKRLRAAAEAWLAENEWAGDSSMQAVVVTGESIETVDFSFTESDN
ncbi:ribonuclease HII [Candidatus Fermentibacteria bacterium]|nr:MAG: ribonuclease HII [Candidatus Fermentibacteria bacterium]